MPGQAEIHRNRSKFHQNLFLTETDKNLYLIKLKISIHIKIDYKTNNFQKQKLSFTNLTSKIKILSKKQANHKYLIGANG